MSYNDCAQSRTRLEKLSGTSATAGSLLRDDTDFIVNSFTRPLCLRAEAETIHRKIVNALSGDQVWGEI